MLLCKFCVHFGKYRILGGGVVCPEAEHGQGFVSGTGFSRTQSGGGALLHFGEAIFIRRIFRQIQLPQIQRGDVRHKIAIVKGRTMLFRLGLGGVVFPGFYLGR